MKSFLSNLLENIFHPLLMPVYAALLPFLYTDLYFLNKTQAFRFFFLIAASSFLIPFMAEIFLKITNKNWFQIQQKYIHLPPYLLSVVLSCTVLYLFFQIRVPFWYIGLFFSSTLTVFITAIVRCFWNISATEIGIGGILGAMMSVCFFVKGANPAVLFIIQFILAGLFGSLQLATTRHTKSQVYVGFLSGWLLGFISIVLFIYIFYFLQ